MLTEEQIDAELERERQRAKSQAARTRKYLRIAAIVILVAMAYPAFYMLRDFWLTTNTKTKILVGLVIAAVAFADVMARRANKRYGHPVSENTISLVTMALMIGGINLAM